MIYTNPRGRRTVLPTIGLPAKKLPSGFTQGPSLTTEAQVFTA